MYLPINIANPEFRKSVYLTIVGMMAKEMALIFRLTAWGGADM